MSKWNKSAVSVRSFVPEDADNVSALFRTVYGDCYVYPDVYLPSVICRNNEQQRWHSVVACVEDQIVGHAVLWMHADCPDSAELALNIVHPGARGMGIATTLGAYLRDYARERGLHTLTIKQVSSHTQSQRLAQTLGFQTTGLLLDYVASPFGNEWRESVVLGCLPLQPYPLPSLSWPASCRDWLDPIEQCFGTHSRIDSPFATTPMAVASHEHRIEVTLTDLHPDNVDEVAQMPKERLIYLRLRLDQHTPAAMQQLRRAGFAYAGFMPGPAQGWYGLMQRGYKAHELELCCPIARKLYQGSLKQYAEPLVSAF
ncbi:GNAT family N-acetyltransferase [Chitinimonas sp. BJB300]|uniref:GNAT family N-acetyltransferase n=1 Tax=Chitinimonas sp. BJB300 TaxID=1559339 RepID=UPI000C0D4C87|nr:GNAT family N-acetyltransferase [Chitinimonas sp. BJB300]PHV13080.1 GNAT family N-acetyltransferase [Chitinimonas sp. BJB300]TSJ87710.1 GNAT family N-acetyltransferase [Chitinimonas sp. BJB300]